ncbi:uncharacterized protein [Physcomitrium patens]|uniref:Uncharacterized protein n=1 Tax=Physcomitrium patens TaxID=3218 RepID=A0A2K1IUR2_PHYPA|nr:uncharacterized protein LOC112272935 isoform X2 [Physcomitrium patens]PNR33015.1 hypothetical protein PHYPA_024958 [Physcomitrium patens]|eukprot:XP_024356901.1 uncharacterized protein LOC112272935 isoform X2 [Physcomitrella patens]
MAALASSSPVSQPALNRISQEIGSCKASHTTVTFRPLSFGHLQGASRSRVHLKICRFSPGLRNDSNLGFFLVSTSRHRLFNGSQVVRKVTPMCAKGGSDDSVGGDPQVQQMLVEMLQIQIGKSRVSDFVDERSQHMRNIAQDTFHQYDRIAYRTMKGLDDSGSRVLRQLDADAQALERELRVARAELEAEELDLEEYQLGVAYSRNEGLFFKNLYPSPKPHRLRSAAISKSSVKEVKNVALARPTRDFSSSYRQVLYVGLSLVIVSFIWSSSSALLAGTWMRASKLASYGMIFSALLTQLAYVKVLVGEEELEEEGPIDVTNNED